jgi:predicted kinase
MTKPKAPILCHLLVGPPASGKTTFSKYLQSQLTEAVVISTDQIRGEQSGDAEIQGDWAAIEKVVIERICNALQAGQPVIYDATNVRRSWRLGFLEQLATSPIQSQSPCQWVAWVLTTPLATCLEWNQQRPRQVPEKVIIDYAQDLQQFAVELAEGFVGVIQLDPAHIPDLTSEIQTQLARLESCQRNRQSRHKQEELHAYSCLLDF